MRITLTPGLEAPCDGVEQTSLTKRLLVAGRPAEKSLRPAAHTSGRCRAMRQRSRFRHVVPKRLRQSTRASHPVRGSDSAESLTAFEKRVNGMSSAVEPRDLKDSSSGGLDERLKRRARKIPREGLQELRKARRRDSTPVTVTPQVSSSRLVEANVHECVELLKEEGKDRGREANPCVRDGRSRTPPVARRRRRAHSDVTSSCRATSASALPR